MNEVTETTESWAPSPTQPGKFVLYHAHCQDGFGCAWAAWKALGCNARYIPVEYQKPIPEIPDGSDVYILDFSYPAKWMESLQKRMNYLMVIDHHEPNFSNLLPVTNTIFDVKHSAAVLTWTYFIGPEVPAILQYVEDRDLWQWKMRFSKEANAAIASYDRSFETWNQIAEGMERPDGLEKLIEEGIAILRAQDQLIERAVANRVEIMVLDIVMPAVNSSVLQSEIGHHLLHVLEDEMKIVAIYWDGPGDVRNFSLRSRRNTFDCAEIAKRYGGGGHKNAAGFTVSNDTSIIFKQ